MMDKRQVFDLARKAGFVDWTDDGDWQGTSCDLFRLVKMAAEHEREACAKVCESLPMRQDVDVRDQCAKAIRARGNT
jgi:hypothetical protein